MDPAAPPEVRLFVYGLLLQSEREHGLLEGAPLLGEVWTAPEHTLVDLDFYPVLLVGGRVAVQGELYGISRHLRFKLDVHHQCPALFRRVALGALRPYPFARKLGESRAPTPCLAAVAERRQNPPGSRVRCPRA